MNPWDLKRPPQPNDWTPEQLETLRRMAGHAPVADIAAAVGRPVRATGEKARRLGLSLAYTKPMRTWTPQELGVVRRMAATHSAADIAAALGRTEASVQARAARTGITLAKSGPANHRATVTPAELEQIAALRAKGWGRVRIAAALGLNPNTVHDIINYRSRWREMLALQTAAD